MSVEATSRPVQIDDLDWQIDATCAQVGGDYWFAGKGAIDDVRTAKRICAGCPARPACHAWVTAWEAAHGETPGIWAGLTMRERRAERLCGAA